MNTDKLQYDTDGNLVARIVQDPDGKWIILPEPAYPFVVEVDTGIVRLWDRVNDRAVKFAKEPGQ